MNGSRENQPDTAASGSDSARQVGDLAAFRRMMLASRGTFSLSFAVCDDRTLRDSLVRRLSEEFPGVLVVRLPTNVNDVYDTVRAQWPSFPPVAVFILDLEASVPFADEAQPALRALNSSREQWERFACPIVFWLAEYAATRLTARAPDFWRYRSHQFEFIPEAVPLSTARQEAFAGYDMVDALPFEEKAFRVTELERRVREAGVHPPADLLPHVLVWTYELAHLLEHANRFTEAEEHLRKALAWAESTFGSEHPETARALANLARLLKITNRMAEAELLIRRALAISEACFGKNHPALARLLNNLALILKATNRLAEAEPLIRRALDNAEAVYGRHDPNYANCLNNLATLLQATGRLAEAEPLMRQALSIVEAAFGQKHPYVALCHNNLAVLLQDTRRWSEAEPLLRRALSIREASYGRYHPEVAVSLNNLAQLLKATNRLNDAEPLMRRALAIDEAGFGQIHPTVASRLNNLAQLLQATNRHLEAEPLLNRALCIDEAAFGQNHPDVAIDLNNIALLFLATNRRAEAEPLMRRAFGILVDFTRTTGHPHPYLEGVTQNYRGLLVQMGDSPAQAQEKIDKLLEPLRSK